MRTFAQSIADRYARQAFTQAKRCARLAVDAPPVEREKLLRTARLYLCDALFWRGWKPHPPLPVVYRTHPGPVLLPWSPGWDRWHQPWHRG